MEVIQSIKKEKTGYLLTTKSGLKMPVSEDSLVKHRLLKGSEISVELLKQVKEEASFDIGYQKALNYLSYQLRSEQEIKDYLKKQEISYPQIVMIIDKLKELSLLDDKVFAESYVRTAIRTTDKGPQGVKEFLMKKGVDSGTIADALVLFGDSHQLELGKKLTEKMLRKYQQKSQKERVNKIRQQLFIKGFHTDVISQLIDELDFDEEEDEYGLLVNQGDKLWRRHERLDSRKRNQKIKQSLYQKGFSFDDINRYIEEKEMELE
ncbi:recombination regulator RecX [Vagococcus bubulae]|uniref:Regulatory protein RecX n=1 Tax=Vagococcus bubulae TaxID=1977868 RepID=A0A429ZIS3_9ENTE|nr:recombination regulator RecX [Vagococcus bubulae]RST93579.1 recombination regulator RecX [Vagococcus bubulae]